MESKNSQLSEQNVVELLNAWSFIGASIRPTNLGTVNKTFFVEAQAGKFILKVYNDSITTAQIQYEHSLLTYLEKANLSFTVPTPIPTLTDETLLMVNHHDSQLRMALLPFILGQQADRKNIAHTYAVGQALGELHCALVGFVERQMSQLPGWGNLYYLHPLVTDPFEIPKSLDLSSTQQQRVVKVFTKVIEAAPNLYKTLPVQATHADFVYPNVLLVDNQVVGVLDFEFATSDLRLIDYVATLDHFSRFPSPQAPRWEFVKAFNTGYTEYISLSPLEVEALTLVWLLQQASCIVYWTGWLREGKATYQSVVDGVTKMLLLEDWFQDNTVKLLSHFTV